MSAAARTNRPGVAAQATRQQLEELDALLQRMLKLPVSPAENETEPEPAYAPPPREYPVETIEPAPPAAQPPEPRMSEPARTRTYPPSYMVVETSAPPYLDDPIPQPPAAAPAPRPDRHVPEYQSEPPYSPPAPTTYPREYHREVAPEPPPTSPMEEMREGDWIPLRSSWQPSAQTWKPLAETWEQAKTSPPVPDPPRPTMPPMPEPRRQPMPPIPEPPLPAMPRSMPSAVPAMPLIPPSPVPPPAPVSSAAPSIAPVESPALLAPVVWFNKGFDACLVPLGPLGRWFQKPGGRGVLGAMGLLALAAACALAVADGIGWTR